MNFSEESVEKSWGKESANESSSKFIPRFDSSFVEFVKDMVFAFLVDGIGLRQFSGVVVDRFFDRMELFYFIDEVSDSEYVQVQVKVQQVQNWKHVYASKRRKLVWVSLPETVTAIFEKERGLK
ncbi:hypothetical protein Tco_0318454 [Tanacetum coccineum]